MSQLLGVKFSKWQIALIVGTPLLIGTTVYIYRKSRGSTPKSDIEEKKKQERSKQSNALDGGGTLSEKELEKKKKNLELEDEKLTPLKEATMYKNEGNNCFRNGKYDEAINFYDKAIAKCPVENRTDLAIFYQNRAAAYEMLKKWKSVKEDCSHSLEYNPRYAKAYFRRAKAHEATKDMRDCLDDITATCLLEMFQNNNTIIFADRVLKQTGREDADAALKDRVAVLPSNNFINTYLRSFVSDPLQLKKLPESAQEAPKGFVRAKLALDEGRYDEILEACTEEIEKSEADSQFKAESLAEAFLLRGTFHLLSGAFEESKNDFEAVIDNSSASDILRAYAYLKRASLHVQLDDKDKCFADFEEAQKLQPNNPDVYHQRAQVHILLDQLQEALQQFELAVKLAPNHAIAFIQKLYAEYRVSLMSGDQMRLMMVMNEFKNAIEKFPNCVECYSLMAQVFSDQQQFQQADQFYEKALKMAPSNASLYVHRAIMMLQWKGDIDKAISLMNRALEVDEKCELAYETMGTIEVQRGNLDRAVELFEKAIRLAKSQGEIAHLYALRNAAIAQINVTRKLGIDMATIASLTNGGVMPA